MAKHATCRGNGRLPACHRLSLGLPAPLSMRFRSTTYPLLNCGRQEPFLIYPSIVSPSKGRHRSSWMYLPGWGETAFPPIPPCKIPMTKSSHSRKHTKKALLGNKETLTPYGCALPYVIQDLEGGTRRDAQSFIPYEFSGTMRLHEILLSCSHNSAEDPSYGRDVVGGVPPERPASLGLILAKATRGSQSPAAHFLCHSEPSRYEREASPRHRPSHYNTQIGTERITEANICL
jgi:hypothetical protein